MQQGRVSSSDFGAFEAPAQDEGAQAEGVDLALEATKGRRVVHLFIDGYITAAIGGGVIWGFEQLALIPSLDDQPVTEEMVFSSLFWSTLGIQLLLSSCIGLVYYVGFEASTGRTLAKFLTGTKVVDIDGRPIGFGQALVRNLIRQIPIDAFSFLFGRGWHDKWSKTRVVRIR